MKKMNLLIVMVALMTLKANAGFLCQAKDAGLGGQQQPSLLVINDNQGGAIAVLSSNAVYGRPLMPLVAAQKVLFSGSHQLSKSPLAIQDLYQLKDKKNGIALLKIVSMPQPHRIQASAPIPGPNPKPHPCPRCSPMSLELSQINAELSYNGKANVPFECQENNL